MLARAAVILAMACMLSGCSLLFVEGPPQVRPGAPVPTTSYCTDEMTLPNLDVIFGTLNAAGSVALFINPGDALDLTDEQAGQLGFAAALTSALQYISGASGKRKVRACRNFVNTPVQPPTVPNPAQIILPDTNRPLWSPGHWLGHAGRRQADALSRPRRPPVVGHQIPVRQPPSDHRRHDVLHLFQRVQFPDVLTRRERVHVSLQVLRRQAMIDALVGALQHGPE